MRLIIGSLALFSPVLAFAQAAAPRTLQVNFGTQLSGWDLIQNIVDFMAGSIGAVTVALFIYGAFKLTASGMYEEWREQGKTLMTQSLIGMVVVLSAYGILRTTLYFLT
jgi:hypothetical protein